MTSNQISNMFFLRAVHREFGNLMNFCLVDLKSVHNMSIKRSVDIKDIHLLLDDTLSCVCNPKNKYDVIGYVIPKTLSNKF